MKDCYILIKIDVMQKAKEKASIYALWSIYNNIERNAGGKKSNKWQIKFIVNKMR